MTIFSEIGILNCACGKPLQRERFHKHRKGFSKEEKSYHQRTDFVPYCPSCDKRASDKEAFGGHSRCLYVSLSKADMQYTPDGEIIPNLAAVIAKVAENKANASFSRLKRW